MSTLELHTPLPRAECVARLRTVVDPWWKPFGAAEARGHVGETSLWLLKRIRYNNSFQTVMTARLTDDGAGTTLRCKFAMALFTRAFLCFWFGIVGAITLAWLLSSLGLISAGPAPTIGPQIFVPLAMICGGGALVAFGRWLARAERACLVDFVCRTCDAKAVVGPVA